jgi:hypothetical protein
MKDPAEGAAARQEKVEIQFDVLAQLEHKARQQGLSLFAYLGLFVTRDTQEEIERHGRVFE